MTLKYLNFGIEDAHELAKLLGHSGTGECIEVECQSISNEAQNALLKILEAPARGHKLVLAHPNPILLLPTLRSRAGVSHFVIEKIPSSVERRHAPPSFPKTDDPEEKQAQRAQAQIYLNSLEAELYERKDWRALEQLAFAQRLLQERELPVRAIIEHICLVI